MLKINLKTNKKPTLILSKGFTLIEVIVATGIFITVMVIGVGGLLTSTNQAKEARAVKVVMDNLNFSMDNISRSLRLGSNYRISSGGTLNPITGGLFGNEIVFRPDESNVGAQDVRFGFNNNRIEKCDPYPYAGPPPGSCVFITTDKINIVDLYFETRGTDVADFIQPSVFIKIKGNVIVNGKTIDFDLHTLASQRNAE